MIDAQSKPFDNGRLTYARFAYEYGIVFLASGKDLRQAFNFGFAADHRVEAPFSSGFCHVDAKFVEHGGVAGRRTSRFR